MFWKVQIYWKFQSFQFRFRHQFQTSVLNQCIKGFQVFYRLFKFLWQTKKIFLKFLPTHFQKFVFFTAILLLYLSQESTNLLENTCIVISESCLIYYCWKMYIGRKKIFRTHAKILKNSKFFIFFQFSYSLHQGLSVDI